MQRRKAGAGRRSFVLGIDAIGRRIICKQNTSLLAERQRP